MTDYGVLANLLVIFTASIAVVFVFHQFKLPSIAGFLVAGALIGPNGLNLISDIGTVQVLARIIHDGSWRNRAVAMRDRRAELRGREAYLKQYVDRPSGEPACLNAGPPRPGLSQRRIRDWSRSVHE